MTAANSPYRWVPTVYSMQGLPAALVMYVSLVFYKNFQLNNIAITIITSLYVLPWLFKPLLAPLLENLGSKKNLVVATQLIMTCLLLLLITSLSSVHFFFLSSFIFFSIAFTAALHDISSDGLYIVALSRHTQAQYVGVRTIFYQLARLTCQGGLIFYAGHLTFSHNTLTAWQIALSLLAVLMLMITIYHYKTLPETLEIKPPHRNKKFSTVFNTFKALPNLFIIIVFAVFYNFPESQLVKIAPLFLLDKTTQGGLAISTQNVGLIYGTIGTACMLIGITISGFLINRFSLKQCLLPVTFFAALMSISYLILSIFQFNHIGLLIVLIGLAQLGFGLANGIYMLWLLQIFAKGIYSMSLYAIGTTLMILGSIFAGAISGYIQHLLGYIGFFIWIIFIYSAIYLLVALKRQQLCN